MRNWDPFFEQNRSDFDCVVFSWTLDIQVLVGWGLTWAWWDLLSGKMDRVGVICWLGYSTRSHPFEELGCGPGNSFSCRLASVFVGTSVFVWLLSHQATNSFCIGWGSLKDKSNRGWNDVCKQRVGSRHPLAIRQWHKGIAEVCFFELFVDNSLGSSDSSLIAQELWNKMHSSTTIRQQFGFSLTTSEKVGIPMSFWITFAWNHML